jgi:hypothetical protein
MRWFKHMAHSHNDEVLSELMDKFGAEGYGVWWLILEKIAGLMDETPRTFARFSLKVWATSAKVSVKKLQSLVTFLEKSGTFIIKMDGEYLSIDCPNLLKYRDEWTERKSRNENKTPEKLPSHSGETPDYARARSDTDTDTDTEEDLKKKYIKKNVRQANDRSLLHNDRKIKLPENFFVSAKHYDYASKNNLPDPDNEIEGFKLHHGARGSKFVNWDLAFFQWLRNAKKFQPKTKSEQAFEKLMEGVI